MRRRSMIEWMLVTGALLVCAIVRLLIACNRQPPAPVRLEPTDIGFQFSINPDGELVELMSSSGQDLLSTQVTEPGETRVLIPDVDLVIESYDYRFESGNKLIIEATSDPKLLLDSIHSQPSEFSNLSFRLAM